MASKKVLMWATTGGRIRWARLQKGMNQTQLGKEINISRSAINGFESDKFNPSRDSIYHIAKILEVNPEWLENGQKIPYEGWDDGILVQEEPVSLDRLAKELDAYREREKSWTEREKMLLEMLSRLLPPAAVGKLLAKEGKAVRFLVANQGAPLVSRAA